jgi:superfamily II DNA helicase RecQ
MVPRISIPTHLIPLCFLHSAKVANRIWNILLQHRKERREIPRAICFCLTRSACTALEVALQNVSDFDVKTYSSDGTDSQRRATLEWFQKRNKRIQVICATKAFGRGIDLDDPVRFVFHTVMPVSLFDVS